MPIKRDGFFIFANYVANFHREKNIILLYKQQYVYLLLMNDVFHVCGNNRKRNQSLTIKNKEK